MKSIAQPRLNVDSVQQGQSGAEKKKKQRLETVK